MKFFKYTFIIILASFLTYLIYLKIPTTDNVIKSPFENAEIKDVYLRKRAFWEASMGQSPIDKEYQFFYKGKKIFTLSQEDEEEFSRKTLTNTIWYNDSIKIFYDFVLDGSKTDSLTIKFNDTK
jgi:hypothetical protein